MFIRKIATNKWNKVSKDIVKNGRKKPLSALHEIDITVNEAKYILKVFLTENSQLVVLEALRIHYELDTANHELITSNLILSSLLEIILFQGIKPIMT